MATPFSPRKVYLAASWMAPVGRYNGKDKENLSFLDMAELCSSIFKNSPVRRRQIEAVVVGSQNPSAFSGVDNTAAKIAGILGISGAKSVLIDTASSSGASAFENAYLEVASGRCDNVLAIGIQKMSDVSSTEATRIIAGVIDRDESEFGLTMPACGALVARALQARLGLTDEEWTAYSALLTQRSQRFAAQNPDAHLNMPVEVADYFCQIVNGKNYRYWYPLRYHDFCPQSDGVAAIILTAKSQDVVVSGLGSATDIPTIADRNYFHSFPATVIAAAHAYAMAGIKDIRTFAGKLHVNMHDPFNGFGPINLVDLGIVSRNRLMDALLDDSLTGRSGAFPVNLTGGLKGRGHPLGATGMIQIVENHRFICEHGFAAGLSHSIGGPINNNVVVLLEQTSHYLERDHAPYKPWGLPSLGKLKPKNINIDALLSAGGALEGTFITSTARFDVKTGRPDAVILIVAFRIEGVKYKFLFGIDGAYYQQIANLLEGQFVIVERLDRSIMVNHIPVRKFYTRTLNGLVELAGSGWKKLTHKRQLTGESVEIDGLEPKGA
ncbi:thiolase family protein [Pelotalea chapellei]|uniref:Thiolase family protein n=1 Tax=Pelotalea chapellei TaxID=44671 RepID=A0ABS5UD11_9BACT|nr:thiolase family protein [Pelotalea chapellei]MBT1073525.1 thiolase family protein [Pelotalea chapellei]